MTDEHKESRKAVSTDHYSTGNEVFLLKILQGLKAGSTILNLNPSSSWWNGTIWHRQGKDIQEYTISMKNHGYNLGMRKVLFLRTYCLGCWQWTVICIETVWILNAHRLLAHPTVKMPEALLLRDSARPNTTVCTIEAITKFRWTVLLHLPENFDLGPSY